MWFSHVGITTLIRVTTQRRREYEDPDSIELQLALNDNTATKAYQQAMFEQGQPAVMFFTDDSKGDYD